MEVGIVTLQGIQGQDLPFEPVRQTVLAGLVPDNAEQDLAHEEGHRVLVDVAPDRVQRGDAGKVPREPELGLGILGHLGFENIQGQEQGHRRLRADAHEEAPPAVFPAQSVKDDGVLTELRAADDYQFRL